MTFDDPQKENGFTPIANELMDELIKYRIPGEQRQCLDYIIRKTYGWNKKEESISLAQFYEATGIKKPSIIRALKELENKKIIISKNANKVYKTYCFNKKYKTWRKLAKKLTVSKKANGVSKKANGVSKKANPLIKDKDTIQKTLLKDIIPFSEIIDFLNEMTGKKYRPTNKGTKALIKARWNEKYTLEDFFTVIANKCDKWLKDPQMVDYLRPETLFAQKHFESYLNETGTRKLNKAEQRLLNNAIACQEFVEEKS